MYPLFWSDFHETRNFSTDFLLTVKYKISWKTVRAGREGWTVFPVLADRHAEADSHFWNFANAPKNVTSLFHQQTVQIQGERVLAQNAAVQEIPRTLLMPKVHFRVHNSPCKVCCALRYGDTNCKLVAPRTKNGGPVSTSQSRVSASNPNYPRLHDKGETSFVV